MPAAKRPMPAKLRQAQRRFESWREGRGKERRIPEVLWRLAAKLGSEIGVSRTSKALRLSYTTLKEHIAEYDNQALEETQPDPIVETQQPIAAPQEEPPSTPAQELSGEPLSASSPTTSGPPTQQSSMRTSPKSAAITPAAKSPAPGVQSPKPYIPSLNFLEFLPTGSTAPPECQLELEDPHGHKMKVHLKGGNLSDLTALSRLFFRRGKP